MPDNSGNDRDEDKRQPDASPYGPQHQVDEAAGGADSSPYETESTGDRADAAPKQPQDHPGKKKN